MRHFYIFNINPNICKLLKQNPYELYRTLETIYYRSEDDVKLGYIFITQLIKPYQLKDLDIELFKQYKSNYFYTKYKNVHKMHDVYRRENTTLSLYKTYIKLETDAIKPKFLDSLNKYPYLFACDFENKDYFWLEALEQLTVSI